YWSIFNSRLVEKVEFYAGGFPARYGDRLSSVLLIENRTADYEKTRGEASLSMSDISGVLEVPLPFANGGALISGRRSYFDFVLKLTDLVKGDYDILPYFFDLNSKVDFSLSQRHKLTLSGLFSRERMYGYFSENPHYTGDFSWESKNSVLSSRLRSTLGDFLLSDFIISWSTMNRSSSHPGDGVEDVREEELTLKQEFAFLFSSYELHLGSWLVAEQENVNINMPTEIAVNFNEVKLKGKGNSFKPSLYVDNKWSISPKVTANFGLRYDYVAKSKEGVLSPRINLAYAWNDHMSLSADYGWYYQSPRAFELAINSSLKSKKAESYGIGVKHQVGDEVVFSLELYNKNLTRLITIDSLWNLSNDGYGDSRGAEFYIQMKSPSGFFGWLSYTYSVSKREEGRNRDLHYFEFDRPHLISLVANYSFAGRWQLGARFRYGSGRPYTPVASAFYDRGTDHWRPIPAEHNSDRYPAYNRLDVRATRHLRFETFTLDELLSIVV
ncbi:MAG: TonB-dependent receptor, partial [Bacteroidota bacterium]